MRARTMTWTMLLPRVAAVIAMAIAVVPTTLHAQAVDYVPGVLPNTWFSGGPGCATFQDDFQVHAYNDDFYILRESGCVHAEKPFLYLLFGQDKAILFDTGAGDNTDPTTGRVPNVVGAVNAVVSQWLARNHRPSIHLVVTHLHSHFDHIWGDSQFAGRPDTSFVPPGSVAALQSFFGIGNWPRDIASYNLGQRVIDIIPIPGHDETSIAVYDRQTGVLLTGDTVYPGRVYINVPDPDVFEASIRRMVDFTQTRLVTHVLGTHIEQRGPYVDYPIGTHFAPDEIPLQLGRAHLLEMLEAASLQERPGKVSGAKADKKRIVQKAYRDFSTCGPYPECNTVNAGPR
jgi:hydroxyacylglutathione hydrolase